MSNLFVACDLRAEFGSVMLGTLHKDNLMMSEVRRFQNPIVHDRKSVQWNIPQLYQETLGALTEIGSYDEAIDGVSCSSWPGDYLLFDSSGAIITPTYHPSDPRSEAGQNEVFSKVPWETLYNETGIQSFPGNTLFQLAAEKPKRLNRASRLMPVADGFNYLLSGVPRVEMSLASATQLFNPATESWSTTLLNTLHLSPTLFPPLIPAGTKLGSLRPDVIKETGIEDAQVIASCSHELAAALVGLPVNKGESLAFLRCDSTAVMGLGLVGPIINDTSRDSGFSNEIGHGGSVRFSRTIPGVWILDECRRFWKEKDRELENDVLTHLAISAPPFECFINFADPRFSEPGDMPLKVQAYCKETGQTVPRKPGPILRCVLESLALLYRKTLKEMEHITGRDLARLYLLDASEYSLLNHFTANALQIPVILVPADSTAIGNVVVQALTLGYLKSLNQAREIVWQSCKMETLHPHAAIWNEAYDRFVELMAA